MKAKSKNKCLLFPFLFQLFFIEYLLNLLQVPNKQKSESVNRNDKCAELENKFVDKHC
jgi:hypothetical protein